MSGSTLSVLKWWFKKRLKYNLGLLFTGLIGFVVQVVQYPFTATNYEIYPGLAYQMRPSAIGLILFLILANAAFTAGWIIDLSFNFKNSLPFRERLFLIGYWFAIACLCILIIAFLRQISLDHIPIN